MIKAYEEVLEKMREIKFRGFYPYWELYDDMKGGWIYGYLGKELGSEEYYIQSIDEEQGYGEGYGVIKETVGQCTGLKDKNNQEIYEGDIVKVRDRYSELIESHRISKFMGVVYFENGSFCIKTDYITHYRWLDYEVEVIGNIYENPELLEV